jgi:hypothetical protein
MVNFQLNLHHGISPEYLDNMIPWEKTIWLSLMEQHIKEKNEELQRQLGSSGPKREFV